jgi:hypothetical protein
VPSKRVGSSLIDRIAWVASTSTEDGSTGIAASTSHPQFLKRGHAGTPWRDTLTSLNMNDRDIA